MSTTQPWKTKRIRGVVVHVAKKGSWVMVVIPTRTHPPWEFHIIPRTVWFDTRKHPSEFDSISVAAGGAGSWQRARKLAEAAMRAARERR